MTRPEPWPLAFIALLYRCVAGKHYETKHAVPYRNVNGKLSRVNYTFEEVHVEAPAKVRLYL